MDWAGRTQDDHPPLVDFEDLSGWTVQAKLSAASFVRTREQQILGPVRGKLTYGRPGMGRRRCASPAAAAAHQGAFRRGELLDLWQQLGLLAQFGHAAGVVSASSRRGRAGVWRAADLT